MVSSKNWSCVLKVGVCASGGGGNLRNLIESGHFKKDYVVEKVLVDRYCGAIEVAKFFTIPYVLAENKDLINKNLIKMFHDGFDLIVLAGFMPILSTEICKTFQRKIVNTHPSLLPRHGGKGMYGVRVQESVLESKDAFGGCTIHFVDEVIDGGDIILQISFAIPPDISAWKLGGLVFQAESVALPLSLSLINKGLV